MNECYKDKKGTMIISIWWKNGYWIVRRDAMPQDHKESMFQCIKRLGENPYIYMDIKRPVCGSGMEGEK